MLSGEQVEATIAVRVMCANAMASRSRGLFPEQNLVLLGKVMTLDVVEGAVEIPGRAERPPEPRDDQAVVSQVGIRLSEHS
jgi:hypothetical protein